MDPVIAALRVVPALRSAAQSAIVKQAEVRYSAAEMRLINQATSYAAGMSATDKIQFEALRGTASPVIAVGAQAAAASKARTAPDTEALLKKESRDEQRIAAGKPDQDAHNAWLESMTSITKTSGIT